MSAMIASDIPAFRGTLTSGRVSVRQFTVEDISNNYLGWLLDPEVVRYSSQRFHAHTTESCQAYLASFAGSANHFLAICERETETLLGTITVYRNVNHGTADIGILMGDRRVWGCGIGSEAFGLVLSALQASGIIRKITAGTLSINLGMVRILEKAGMQHEATRYAQELIDDIPVNVVYYAKFCHD